MRLIDAEQLKQLREDVISGKVDIQTEGDLIDACPTVNPYEWIRVEDRLPEKFTHVLCLYPSKNYGSNIVVDYMESDRGYFAYQFKYGEPTHWMPLPAPPTEKEN